MTVVGYTTISPNANGSKALGLNFVGVSTGATKLGDLTVSNYQLEKTEEDEGYEYWEFTGLIEASKLDDQGKPAIDPVTKQYCVYSWVDYKEYEEGDLIDSFTGWYDTTGKSANEVDLELGSALWVYSDSSDYQLTFPAALEK